MKRELLFAFAAFFFLSSSVLTGAFAVEESKEITSLSEEQMDLTGDGKVETIYLKGKRFEEGTDYLRDILIEIKEHDGKQYTINLDGGYDPHVQFADINHDGIADLFVSVLTEGSGGLSHFHLYTIKGSKLTNLPVPDPLVIQSQFLDHYKGRITVDLTKKNYEFDLKNRAKAYEELGLYQEGKLSEPTELMVHAFHSLKPVNCKGERLCLSGVQRISGASNADSIAFVESTWLYDKAKWMLVDTKVMQMKHKKHRRKG
jgi:hypothetical protein